MKKQRWIIGVYNDQFKLIKELRQVVGTYDKAEKVCEIIGKRHPKKIIMFDQA